MIEHCVKTHVLHANIPCETYTMLEHDKWQQHFDKHEFWFNSSQYKLFLLFHNLMVYASTLQTCVFLSGVTQGHVLFHSIPEPLCL